MLADFFNNVTNNLTYSHSVKSITRSMDFHLHNLFEIYFFISGDVNYFIEKKVYTLKYGDLIIINNLEIHKPSFQTSSPYERILIHFNPDIFESFSPEGFNLLNCFINRPSGEQNKINLTSTESEELVKLFSKMETAAKNKVTGWEILKLSYFLEILVLINRAFMNVQVTDEITNVPEKLVPILDFIDDNLDKNLSLDILQNMFYINKFHLSRMFKKSTGSSIHEYILFKRLSRAKMLLSSGKSVTESCIISGFSDYSHFIRIFKKTTGISPGKYGKKYPTKT